MISALLRELDIKEATASSTTTGQGPDLAIDSNLLTFFKSDDGAKDKVPFLKVTLSEAAVVKEVKVVNKYKTITNYCKTQKNSCVLPMNRTEVYLHDDTGEWENIRH